MAFNKPKNTTSGQSLPMQQPEILQRSSSTSSHNSILTHTANSFTPITAHYSLNETLLKAFFQLYESGKSSGSTGYVIHQYTTALTIGLQYCRVALWDIPQHGYYNSPKYQDLKLKSSENSVKVSDLIVLKLLPQLERARQDHLQRLLPDEVISYQDNYGEKSKQSNSKTPSNYQTEQIHQTELLENLEDQIQEAQILHECAYETLKQVKAELREINKKRFGIFGIKPSPQISWKQHKVRSSSTSAHLLDRLLGDCSDAAAVLCPTSDALNTVVEDEEEYSKISTVTNDTASISNQTLSSLSERKRPEHFQSNRGLERTYSAPERVLSPKSQGVSSSPAKHSTAVSLSPVIPIDDTSSPQSKVKRRESKETGSRSQNEGRDSFIEQDFLINEALDEDQQIMANGTISTSQNKTTHTNILSQEQAQYESDLGRALYLSGLTGLPSSPSSGTSQTNSSDRHEIETSITSAEVFRSSPPAKNLRPVGPNTMDILTLSSLYREDYEEMNESGLIRVNFIDTYQGRIPGSTNGCTVIAPLLAIHHLCPTKISLLERNSTLEEGMKWSTTAGDITSATCSVHSDSSNVSNGYSNNPADDNNDRKRSKAKQLDSILTIDDETIATVIDVQTPLVLPKVRSLMGLQKDALIIPSDVHDYLINEDFIAPRQFVDVFGGNILDDQHLLQFLKKLSTFGNESTSNKSTMSSEKSENDSARRVAATLYFHEHVVCIHRLTTEICTDIIDNMDSQKSKELANNKHRLNNQGKRSNNRNLFHRFRGKMKQNQGSGMIIEQKSWFDVIDSLPSAVMFSRNNKASVQDITDSENQWLSNTARVTCNDVSSLQAYLRFYACSKFTPDDQKFVNSYQWDDRNVEFDPRVFQAFIWSN